MNNLTQLIMGRFKKRHHQPNVKQRLFCSSRDWLIGLGLFLLVVLGGSYASGSIFMQYSAISVEPTETTIMLPRYNQQGVVDVLSAYQGRAERYQSLKQGAQVAPPAVSKPVAVVPTAPSTTAVVSEMPAPVESVVEVSVPVLE